MNIAKKKQNTKQTRKKTNTGGRQWQGKYESVEKECKVKDACTGYGGHKKKVRKEKVGCREEDGIHGAHEFTGRENKEKVG